MPVERKEVRCIGKQCRYNKGNCGEYCGLKNSIFTQKGDVCILGERIAEIEAEICELQSTASTMKEYQQSLRASNS